MKKLLVVSRSYITIILMLITSVFSCNSNKKSNKESDSLQQTIPSPKVNISNEAITKLPFGSDILMSYKFPKNWDITDDDTAGQKPFEKKFGQMEQYYNKINEAQSSAHIPTIKGINYIKLDDDSLIIKDTRKFNSSFKYRLPDFGVYECYYSYNAYNNDNNPITTTDKKNYFGIGSLILFNKQTSLANIIDLYQLYSDSEGLSEFTRYFYVDSNKNNEMIVKIFKGGGTESSASFHQTEDISISSDGKIIVKNSTSNTTR